MVCAEVQQACMSQLGLLRRGVGQAAIRHTGNSAYIGMYFVGKSFKGFRQLHLYYTRQAFRQGAAAPGTDVGTSAHSCCRQGHWHWPPGRYILAGPFMYRAVTVHAHVGAGCWCSVSPSQLRCTHKRNSMPHFTLKGWPAGQPDRQVRDHKIYHRLEKHQETRPDQAQLDELEGLARSMLPHQAPSTPNTNQL